MMKEKVILTRENQPTKELSEMVKTEFRGVQLEYLEFFYLDHPVDEETFMVDTSKVEKQFTEDQVSRNMKAFKSAYNIAKGAASPKEIIEFRTRLQIAATTLSKILGFGKNTISVIEQEGVSSLPTGRMIKMALQDIDSMVKYIQMCDDIDKDKKQELTQKLMAV